MFKSNSSLILLFILIFTACKKEDPQIPNEEELITTLIYTLTPAGGGSAVIFSFKDLDGDGGNAPVISAGSLSKNTSYIGTLELLNELESPTVNITDEVKAEGQVHQFFFIPASVLNLTIQYDDSDANGKPVGLKSKLTTTSSGSGKLTITLRHEPDKSASGVASGDISQAGGETDITVDFDVQVL